MTHEEQLSNKLYRNWVRAALGLKYLKEGVVDLVNIEVEGLHRTFLNDIGNSLGSKNVACGHCTTENVVPCPTKGICVVRKGGKCTFHDVNDPFKFYRKCPNQICDKLFDKIVAEHRYGSPSWKNTDASKWCVNPWEIAKCYMAESGYKDKATAAQTDCPGILSVVINGRFMQNALSAQISPPNPDIFSQNRQARNAIMHSATLEVTDPQLVQYIDDMTALLKDKKMLVHNQEAIKATQKLIQLKTDQVTITTQDELEVRKEALNAIEEKKREALLNIEAEFIGKKAEAMEAIDRKLSEGLQAADAQLKSLEAQQSVAMNLQETERDISNKQQAFISTADEKGTEVRQIIAASRDEQIKYLLVTRDKLAADLEAKAGSYETQMEVKLDSALQKTLAVLEQAKGNFQQQQTVLIDKFSRIQQDLQTCQNNIGRFQTELQSLTERHRERVEWIHSYHIRREKLQKSLREMYQRHLSTVPVSPLVEEINASIDTFYTELVIRDDLLHDPDKRKTPDGAAVVRSYRDVFYKKEIAGKRIFVLGGAGMGKTTWSLKLVNVWLTCLNKKEA